MLKAFIFYVNDRLTVADPLLKVLYSDIYAFELEIA